MLWISIYYAENIGTIAENLKEVATWLTMPGCLNAYDKINDTGSNGIKKQIFGL
jgi:hypothetical protein